MSPPSTTFRFLNLPRELRDEFYAYTLCSFTPRRTRYTIPESASVVSCRPVFEKRYFTGTLNLLLANKQIHSEGYQLMLSRNIFVLVSCQDFRCHVPIQGRIPHIFVLSARYESGPPDGNVDAYPWYNMIVRMHPDGTSTRFGNTQPREQDSLDVVMLWEDCFEVFARMLYCGRSYVYETPFRAPFRNPLGVAVNLTAKKKEWDGGDSYTELWETRLDICQRTLLRPLRDGLRGYEHFVIEGCEDEALAVEVAREVSGQRTMDGAAVRTRLEGYVCEARTAWGMERAKECAQMCAEGIELFHLGERLVPPSYGNDGGYILQVSLSCRTLRFFLARCTNAYLSTLLEKCFEQKKSSHIADVLQHFVMMLDTRLESFSYPFTVEEDAEMSYMVARCRRLLTEFCGWETCEDQKQHIARALRLCPDNVVYREEERLQRSPL